MRIELLPGQLNVVRFPVEFRVAPSVGLLREIAPDVREVYAMAEAFGIEGPVHGLRDQVDRETAERIDAMANADGELPDGFLDDWLHSMVVEAVEVCRVAHGKSLGVAKVQAALLALETGSRYGIEDLRVEAEAVTLGMAESLVRSYDCVERVLGAARAVSIARQGKKWTARCVGDEDDALMALGSLTPPN